MDFQKAKQIFAARGGTLRTTEALDAGVHPRTLYAMRDRGELQALSRGVYRLKGAAGNKVSDLAVLAKRMPQGVVCLRSALAFHQLGGKPKTGIDLALPRTAGAHSAYISKQNVYRFGDEAYCAGSGLAASEVLLSPANDWGLPERSTSRSCRAVRRSLSSTARGGPSVPARRPNPSMR